MGWRKRMKKGKRGTRAKPTRDTDGKCEKNVHVGYRFNDCETVWLAILEDEAGGHSLEKKK